MRNAIEKVNCTLTIQDQFESTITGLIMLMKAQSVIFETGLTDGEVDRIEQQFGFVFPLDLRALLQSALPIGIEGDRFLSFPNWRSGELSDLQSRLRWPLEGMVFDIENHAFWTEAWAPKPGQLADAVKVARSQCRRGTKTDPRLQAPISS